VRTGHRVRGRDGCRVPLPWRADSPGFGFGPAGATAPWLPQPPAWRELAADAQAADPGSMLALYRTALRLRAAAPELSADDLTWLDAPDGVLAFARPGGLTAVVNISGQPVPLPPGELLLASGPLASDPLDGGPLDGALLPADTAAWIRPS
jgi:alpha-glucosidase